MKKICPQCGIEFECTHDLTCFCGKYVIDEKTLKFLKEKYTNCLCENCLKQYSCNNSKK